MLPVDMVREIASEETCCNGLAKLINDMFSDGLSDKTLDKLENLTASKLIAIPV